MQANRRGRLLGFFGLRLRRRKSGASGSEAHWRIENGSHYVRDVAFAEDASRIRKNPDIVARLRSFAYNLLARHRDAENIKNAR